jgi:cyclopropane fatty-acyl-phospholipid synthase-like methyltransferase
MTTDSPWYETMFAGLYAKVLPNVFTAEQTLQQAQGVKRLLKLRKGQQVLDIPSGMGRLTVPLAKMGLRMTGVDLQGSYIRRARRHAGREHLDICFLQCDMRRIDFDSRFDAIFNWFGSFGYFSDKDNLEFCRRVLRALKPGGRFLLETMNKTWLLPHFRHRSDDLIGGIRIRRAAQWDSGHSRVIDQWTMHDGHAPERRRISIRVYDSQEMRHLLKTAGFTDIQLFANLSRDRFTRHSRRMVAVARRPAG